jgi:steroid delta-isomerase-like uncharacterized protein
MTATATKKLITAYYDAFNAGNTQGMLDCIGASFIHEISQGERRKGKAKFAAFLKHMNSSYRERLSNIEIMTNSSGSRAAAEFDLRGTYLKTDPGLPTARKQAYKLRVGAFFEIEDGKIVRVSTHYNLKDWKRQVAGE